MILVDIALRLVNRSQEILEGWESRLISKKYPVPTEPSELSQQFVKSYGAEIRATFERDGSRLKLWNSVTSSNQLSG